MSALERCSAFQSGVIGVKDLVYFLSLIAGGTTAAGLLVGASRAGGR